MNPRQANDQALEWAIVLARGVSVGCAISALMTLVLAALWLSPPVAYAGGVQLVGAGLIGWFGWWQYGNPEWRGGIQVRPDVCNVVHLESGLVCRVRITPGHAHPGSHWDSVADPEGKSRWS